MNVGIYAGWLIPEEKIGTLIITRSRGKETIAVELEKTWINAHSGTVLDPDIAPFRGIQYPPSDKALFGFLSDSCPDRWGRRLIEREERIKADQEKRAVRTLNESDYLLGISDQLRYGGIRFRKEDSGEYLSASASKIPPMTELRMLEAAAHGYETSANDAQVLKILLEPGSSLGGARPKANVQDADGALWIAKFPSQKDDYDVGAWEMAEHDLAGLCGIDVPDAKVLKLSSYGSTFLIKRFDRNGSRRMHLMSAMTALGMTDGHTDGAGYIDLAGITEQISSQPGADLGELWRRMAFNVLTSNCDDHLRNHGFILKENGWQLSPAYDLNPVPGKDALSLNITDSDSRRNIRNAVAVSELFRISENEASERIRVMQETVRDHWRILARRYGISGHEIDRMAPAFALCEAMI